MKGVLAYVGLGSNLDEPVTQLQNALNELAEMPCSRLLRQSSFYQTPPWGVAEQPEFVNAVAEIRTDLAPRQVLEELLDIERRAGRIRGGEQWGPRVIDLDLLVHGDSRIEENDLCVPHPRMFERAFVLVPLAELDASLRLPGYGLVGDCLGRLDTSLCRRIQTLGDP